jgi:hypothetical protein
MLSGNTASQGIVRASAGTAYTLTGEVVNLEAHISIKAASGAFALTGNTAAAHWTIAHGAGAFALTGYDASLLKQKVYRARGRDLSDEYVQLIEGSGAFVRSNDESGPYIIAFDRSEGKP